MPRRTHFWRGFAAGAGGTLAGLIAANMIGNARRSRIVRIEKSLQVGRPVPQVFRTWASLEWLQRASPLIVDIHANGKRSHWTMQIDGHRVQWDAEIEQFLPDQAIGWKSVNGPKHTGRITFAPIGDDTLVQVTMNYVPPLQLFHPFARQMRWPLQHWVERVLRDFKASLEGKGQEERRPAIRSDSDSIGPGTGMGQTDLERATGTYGRPPERMEPRFDERPNPVDYTRPPEAKS
jgi:uncharacterized membrane protein